MTQEDFVLRWLFTKLAILIPAKYSENDIAPEVILRWWIETLAGLYPTKSNKMTKIHFEITLYIFLGRFLTDKELQASIENYESAIKSFEQAFGENLKVKNEASITYGFMNEQLDRFRVIRTKRH